MKNLKWLLCAVLLLIPVAANSQMTCSPVTPGVSQNCLVTVTVKPGTPSGNQVQATDFKIRRADGSGAKTQIGTVPFSNPVFQNTFSDAGNVKHCWDAIGSKSGSSDSPAGPEQCWTSPALAPATVTTPGGITLSAISATAIRITWDGAPSQTEVWGRAAKGEQDFNLYASLPADTVTYDWGGLRKYTSYCARLRGKAGESVSGFSEIYCATTNTK